MLRWPMCLGVLGLFFLTGISAANDWRERISRALQLNIDHERQLLIVAGFYDEGKKDIKTFSNENLRIPDHVNDRRFEIGSITKVFLGYLVHELVTSGKLSLNDKVVDHLPNLPPKKYEHLSIENLLAHHHKLPDLSELLDRDIKTLKGITRQEIIHHLVNYDIEPGHEVRYSNVGYALLQFIVEDQFSSSGRQLVYEKILTPIGIGQISDTMNGHDSTWKELGPSDFGDLYLIGGMVLSPNDMLKLLASLFENRQLFPLTFFDVLVEHEQFSMGYGWSSIESSDQRILSHHGRTNSFSSTIVMDTTNKKGVVVVTNTGINVSCVISAYLAEDCKPKKVSLTIRFWKWWNRCKRFLTTPSTQVPRP